MYQKEKQKEKLNNIKMNKNDELTRLIHFAQNIK